MARDPPPKPKRGKTNRWYTGEEFNRDEEGEEFGDIAAADLGAGGRLVGPQLMRLQPAPGEKRISRKRRRGD